MAPLWSGESVVLTPPRPALSGGFLFPVPSGLHQAVDSVLHGQAKEQAHRALCRELRVAYRTPQYERRGKTRPTPVAPAEAVLALAGSPNRGLLRRRTAQPLLAPLAFAYRPRFNLRVARPDAYRVIRSYRRPVRLRCHTILPPASFSVRRHAPERALEDPSRLEGRAELQLYLGVF